MFNKPQTICLESQDIQLTPSIQYIYIRRVRLDINLSLALVHSIPSWFGQNLSVFSRKLGLKAYCPNIYTVPSGHLRILKLGPALMQFQKSLSIMTPVMSHDMSPKEVA